MTERNSYCILVPWKNNPNVKVQVEFRRSDREGFWHVYIASTYMGTFHTQMCGISLAEELVNS